MPRNKSAPPHRPSAWWWKCAACKAELFRSKRTYGPCVCWECRHVGAASTQMALWGHEWKLVAWMALAVSMDTDWDAATFVTGELYDPNIVERWVADDRCVPDRFLPKDDDAEE